MLEITDAEWDRHLEGCGAVVSCLGHVIGVRGIWGPPWRLCTRAAREAASAIERRGEPTRLILMNTVGVPAPGDPARSLGERALLAALRVAVPPHADNIAAAALVRSLGEHPSVRWCVVRPDALTEDEPAEPAVSASPPGPLFPGMKSSRATIAAFMVRLVTDDDAWEAWRQRSPVVVDAQDDQASEEA